MTRVTRRVCAMPPVDVVRLEEAAPDTPYGIKGIGEMGLIATPAAVAGALRISTASGAGDCRSVPSPSLAGRPRGDGCGPQRPRPRWFPRSG